MADFFSKPFDRFCRLLPWHVRAGTTVTLSQSQPPLHEQDGEYILSVSANSYVVCTLLQHCELSILTRERLADDKLCEISVCVSPTQAKKYAIKPVIPETYHQPDALYA